MEQKQVEGERATALEGEAFVARDNANHDELSELKALAGQARQRIRRRRESERRSERAWLETSGQDALVVTPIVPAPLPEMVRRAKDKGRRWASVGLIGVALVASAVALFIAFSQPEPRREVPVAQMPLVVTVPTPIPTPAAVPAPSAVVPTSNPTPNPNSETVAAAPKKAAPAKVKAAAKEAADDVGEEAARPAKKTGGESIDQLLEGMPQAPQAKDDEAVAPAEPEAPAKTSLAREDVNRSMGRIAPKVSACGKTHQQSGTVMVHFTVEPSGKVSAAEVKSPTDSAAFSSCVEAWVAKAKFPAFSGRPTSFTFPFIVN